MPYNTRLYYNTNKRALLISLVTLCLVLVFPAFFDFSGHSQNAPMDYTKGTPGIDALPPGQSVESEMAADKALLAATSANNPKAIIHALIVLGKIKNLKGDQAKALELYQKASGLAIQNKLPAEQCMALLYTGEIVYKKGQYDQSRFFFQEANVIAKANNFEQLQALALYYLGKYNHTTGNFELAKTCYLQSVAISRKYKDYRQLVLSLTCLGKSHIGEGNLKAALQNYQESFYLSLRINDPLLSADACNHLGGLYLETRDYKKAMEYHRKALQYRLGLNYPGELAVSYNNVGKVYSSLGHYDSAAYYYERSLNLCKKVNYKKGQVKALINLGEVYRLTNRKQQSQAMLSEAFQMASHINYENGIAKAGIDLGDLYNTMGISDSAVSYYLTALKKLTKSNYNEDLLRAYKGLYSCFLARQDFKKALEYHEHMLDIEKKLLDVENRRQLAILNITFDTERKEKDFSVLLKDNELKASLLKSKNTFIGLIVSVLCFMVLLCVYFYNRFYFRKKAHLKLKSLYGQLSERNNEFEKLNRELGEMSKEKDKLFSIIAHELRNPLFWLQNLTETLSRKHQAMAPDKIHKTLLSLDESARNVYHLMDNLLHWSRSKLNRIHPVKSDHDLCRITNDTVRMYDGFFKQKEIVFYNSIPEGIMVYADADLLSCVIRNLVSNAIKYTPRGGTIGICHQLAPGHATITVSDSGKGFAPSIQNHVFDEDKNMSAPGLMHEKGSGLGLKLCRDFVELNGGHIYVESLPGKGTKVSFSVPLSVSFSIAQQEPTVEQLVIS